MEKEWKQKTANSPLLPSLSGKNMARLVRKRVVESKINWNGFNWKKAMIYLLTNKHLVGKMDKDVRKSNRGVQPGMTSMGMNNKENSEEMQWYYPRKIPSKEIIRKMIGMLAEVGIRELWDNYTYDFGEKNLPTRRRKTYWAKANHGSLQVGHGGVF